MQPLRTLGMNSVCPIVPGGYTEWSWVPEIPSSLNAFSLKMLYLVRTCIQCALVIIYVFESHITLQRRIPRVMELVSRVSWPIYLWPRLPKTHNLRVSPIPSFPQCSPSPEHGYKDKKTPQYILPDGPVTQECGVIHHHERQR